MELIDIYINKIQKNINKQNKVIIFSILISTLLLFVSLVSLINIQISTIIISIVTILILTIIFKNIFKNIFKKEILNNIILNEYEDDVNITMIIDNNILSYDYLIKKINKNSSFIIDSLKENNIIINNIVFNLINTEDMILNISEKNGVYINVSKGLLLNLNNDEFKSILSHELSHFLFKDYYTFKSSIKVFNFSKTLINLSFILLNIISITKSILDISISRYIYVLAIIHFILYLVINKLSKQENLNSNHSFEFRADLNAIKIFNQDPVVLKTALEKILKNKKIDEATNTHPKLEDRIKLIEKGAIL